MTVLQEGGHPTGRGLPGAVQKSVLFEAKLESPVGPEWAVGGRLVSEDRSLPETACGREMGWEALASVPRVPWAAPAPQTLLTCFQAFGPVFRSSPRFHLSRPTPPLPGGCVPVLGTP